MTDYISREAAIEKITALINKSGKYTAYESGADDACFILEHEIPAADVRPVVYASWVPYQFMDDMRIKHYSCSVCKRVVFIPHGRDVKKEMPYCHCGADMRGLPE